MAEILVTCPCCGQTCDAKAQANLMGLPILEWPWYARTEDWAIRLAQDAKIQWACDDCLKRGRAERADISKQTFCDAPPYLAFYDTTYFCEDCGKEFVFGTSEQRYWYEELQFWVQSRPKQCKDCRKKRRVQVHANLAYQHALETLDISNPSSLLEVVRAATNAGYTEKAKLRYKQARNVAVAAGRFEALQQQFSDLEVAIANLVDQSGRAEV